MATFEDGIKAYLGGSPFPLAVGPRVYSHAAPQGGETPYVVFYRISLTPHMTHHGPPGMIERQYQFSVFGMSQSAVLGIADSIRAALNGFKGTMGSYTVGGVFLSSERADFNEVTKMHGVSADYSFQYYE